MHCPVVNKTKKLVPFKLTLIAFCPQERTNVSKLIKAGQVFLPQLLHKVMLGFLLTNLVPGPHILHAAQKFCG